MIRINKQQTKTDEAWERLYSRLTKEQLIHEPKQLISHKVLLKWGSIAAVAVGIVFILFIENLWPDRVEEGQPLITQKNEKASMLVTTLEDGSVVYLGRESSLQYPERFAVHKREVNLCGEAYFDIAKRSEQTFLIETEQVRIEVLGTAFHVCSDESAPFSLSVRRGKVRVTLKQGEQTLLVNAGETVTLQARQLELSKSENEQQFDRYTRNIRFKDACIEDILRVVNTYTMAGQIATATPELGKRRLTIEFSDYSPQSVAELMGWALSLKCTQQGDTWVLSE